SYVELVHDRVRLVVRAPVVTPIEVALRGAGDEQPDGRAPGVRPGPTRGLPVELGRKEDRSGVGVEEDLVGIELVGGRSRPVDRVRVIARARRGRGRGAAVPHVAGLVLPGVDSVREG